MAQWVSLRELWTVRIFLRCRGKTFANSLCASLVLLSAQYPQGHLGKQELFRQNNPWTFCIFKITITGKCSCPSLLKYNDSMILILCLELFCGRHLKKGTQGNMLLTEMKRRNEDGFVWLDERDVACGHLIPSLWGHSATG